MERSELALLSRCEMEDVRMVEYLPEGVLLSRIERDYAYSTEQYHHHAGYEIYFLNRGEREFVCAGKMFTVQAGDVFLVRPDVLHYAYGEIPHEKYGVEFSEKYISHYLTPAAREEVLGVFEQNHIVLNEEEQAKFRQVYLETMKRFQMEERDNSLCFMGVLLMLGILKEAVSRQESEDGRAAQPWQEAPESLRTVIAYIRGHYMSIHSLMDIADSCYVNKYYLSRSFRKYVGMTVMEYVNMLRLEQACELLVKTGLSVGEIAESCGFINKSHFSTLFKRHMGTSPMEFKKARKDYRGSSEKSGSIRKR